MHQHELFDEVLELPDPEMKQQFEGLAGLDELKELLIKQGRLLLNPQLLEEWSKKKHGRLLQAVSVFQRRPPLILFSGDVGTGKTSLADSFGDAIARREGIKVTVFRLSLITRGQGAVGEMTHLISSAFEEVEKQASAKAQSGRRGSGAVILIIDEADALAESRAMEQMHHEDRAGVNALIRGIDRFCRKRLPVLIVLCTNRDQAIDPAVLRRAAAHYQFFRPNLEQRVNVLRGALDGVLSEPQLRTLAEAMGEVEGRTYGYTYSDITQRFVPGLLLDAFPDTSITFDLALSLAHRIAPTKPLDAEATSSST